MVIENNKQLEESKISKQAWWQPAVSLFLQLSSWIVFPILVALVVGKWLDKKYDTEPWLFLGTVAISFLVSMIGLVQNAKKEYKKIEDLKK